MRSVLWLEIACFGSRGAERQVQIVGVRRPGMTECAIEEAALDDPRRYKACDNVVRQ